ncbi:hypothetical protein BYT27DRAFT_7182527 [Phlegmacium glaucopus]|nr:hypothetical protein BYT27DRAFT_7182527 [Phlegmacium glaucopus]
MTTFWAFAKKPEPEGRIKKFCSDSVNSKLACIVTSGDDSDIGRWVFGSMSVGGVPEPVCLATADIDVSTDTEIGEIPCASLLATATAAGT